jgi:cytochrome bd ubiquinol oxidase subunit II
MAGGSVILFPSLALLFRLFLGGVFDRPPATRPPTAGAIALPASAAGRLARAASACLVIGIGFLTVAEAGWAHAIGATALLAFVALGFLAAVPLALQRGGPR